LRPRNASEGWFRRRNPEGVAFEYPVIGELVFGIMGEDGDLPVPLPNFHVVAINQRLGRLDGRLGPGIASFAAERD